LFCCIVALVSLTFGLLLRGLLPDLLFVDLVRLALGGNGVLADDASDFTVVAPAAAAAAASNICVPTTAVATPQFCESVEPPPPP
jgi:hypothetical protein